MTPKQKLLCSLLAFTAGSFVHAQDYILPVDADASSSFFGAARTDATIRNISGKWGSSTASGLTINNTSGTTESWVSGGGAAGEWVSFDLGGQYNLSAVNILQSSTLSARNINQFDVQVSNDNSSWTNVLTDATATQGGGNQNFGVTATNVRYARVFIDSNHTGTTGFTNLQNVLFEGTAAANQYYVDMTTVGATTTMGSFLPTPGGFNISQTTSNIGINVPANAAGSTASDDGTLNWVSSAGNTGDPLGSQYLTFSLAAATDVQSVILYNGNDDVNAVRGIQQFDIEVSTDGGSNFSAVITDAQMGITSNSNIWVPGENWLIDQAGVTDIRLIVDSNHGDANYTMFNGLQIIAVPEPQSFALLGGLLALGFTALRRRR